MIVYNAQLPKRTYEDKEVCDEAYSSRNYRAADINQVYKKELGLQKLLDNAPLWHHHTRILIDVKKQTLEPKQYTCVNKGWHLDGRLNTKPRSTGDNIYHLILWGGAPTIFIKEPFRIATLGAEQNKIAHILNFDSKVKYEVPKYIWHSYGEYHWHKCGRATVPCTRTFIRITETDYVKAQKII